MSLVLERALLLAGSETVHGTNPGLSGANAVIVEGIGHTIPHDIVEQDEIVNGSMSTAKPIHGRKLTELTFMVPWKASGSPGDVPEWHPFMLAAGMEATISAGTSVTYTPANNPNDMSTCPSCSIEYYVDGVMWEVRACRGTVSMSMEAGTRGMLEFTFTGIGYPAVDAGVPTPSGLDPTDPPLVQAASFSMGGYADVIQALSLESNNEVNAAESVNGVNAYGRIDITGRNWQGSYNPEATLVATRDHWGLWEANTEHPMTIQLGASAGNIITVTAPAAVYRELTPGERNNIMVYDVPLSFAPGSQAGNDEVSVVLT